jgi:alpha-glucosidase
LELYRAALRIHRSEPGLGDGEMTWLEAPDGVLAFRRAGRFACVANLSPAPVPLPAHEEVLLASAPLKDGCLPTDATAWIRVV